MKLSKVKNALVAAALACGLMVSPATLAFADEAANGTGAVEGAGVIADDGYVEVIPWTVTFDGENMTSTGTRDGKDIRDSVAGLQPGDSAVFDITLINACDTDVDWWVRNKVERTMEGQNDALVDDGANEGGYYSYTLEYEGKALFSNGMVGGDAVAPTRNTTSVQAAPEAGDGAGKPDNAAKSGGLFNATQNSGMEDYFFLGTFGPGQQRTMKLTMAIDGETHTNNYFDTDAGALLQYAAEPTGTGSIVYQQDPERYEYSVSGVALPQTGDLLPLFTVLCFLLGCLVLAVGGASYMNDLKRAKEGAGNENDQ